MKLILSLIALLFFACDNGGGVDSLGTVISVDYGAGAPCGGSVMNYYGSIYPSLINVCLGLITIHGFLFGVGKILFQETLLGCSMVVVAVFTMVLLIKRINYSENL